MCQHSFFGPCPEGPVSSVEARRPSLTPCTLSIDPSEGPRSMQGAPEDAALAPEPRRA